MKPETQKKIGYFCERTKFAKTLLKAKAIIMEGLRRLEKKHFFLRDFY